MPSFGREGDWEELLASTSPLDVAIEMSVMFERNSICIALLKSPNSATFKIILDLHLQFLFQTDRSKSIMSKPDALQHNLQLILKDRQRKGWQLEPPAPGSLTDMVDFGSNDTLSLSSSGLLGKEFLNELGKHPNFILGGRASRWGEGSTDYLFQLEQHIAQFHKADSALFFNTGYEANVAIFSTLPQPHDVVLYDSLVHASIREGMYRGRATALPFAHNDLSNLRQRLQAIKHQYERVRTGLALVFVALESFYSMDGDAAPLQAIVREVKEQLPIGNVVFVIDEAHSTGLVGPQGSGLVSYLGLEKDFSIRVHTFGKAHGASGGKLQVQLQL